MEHLRVLIHGLDPGFEPLLAVRPDDGEQTRTLAERTGVETCALGSRRGVGEVRRLCHDRRIDIVHIHTPVTSGVPKMMLAARSGGARAEIVTYHQVQLHRSGLRRRMVNRLAQRWFARHTIAVGHAVADSLASQAGLDRARVEVIYNGVEPYPAAEPRTTVVVRDDGEVWAGYFGRLAAEKGLGTLLDALALLAGRSPVIRVVIVGDGYERAALIARANELALGDTVLFAGYRDDARTIMREVDFMVHPPLFEGLPYALIEAAEAGLPIVATNVPGGISEVVAHGVNGLLVPPGDPRALAEALATLAGDPALRARLGANGARRYRDQFTSGRMVDRVCALYHGLFSSGVAAGA